MKRIITLVCIVEDPEVAHAIWDHHAKGTLVSGVRITQISEGNAIEIPDEVCTILADMDPDYPDKDDLKAAVEMSEKYYELQTAWYESRGVAVTKLADPEENTEELNEPKL